MILPAPDNNQILVRRLIIVCAFEMRKLGHKAALSSGSPLIEENFAVTRAVLRTFLRDLASEPSFR